MWNKQIDKPKPFKPLIILLDDGSQVKGCWMEHHLFTTKRGWIVDDQLVDWRQVEGWKYEQIFEDGEDEK